MNEHWRKTLDLIIGTTIGIISAIFLNWIWLIVLVVLYAFIKTIGFAILMMKEPDEFYEILSSKANNGNIPDNYNSKSFKAGYIVTFIVSGFFTCLFVVSLFAVLNKLAYSFALSRPAIIIVLSILNTLLIFGTLRKIWKAG